MTAFKSIVLYILLFSGFSTIHAQETTVIQGKVVDDMGVLLEFVNAYVNCENLDTVTNEFQVQFERLPKKNVFFDTKNEKSK